MINALNFGWTDNTYITALDLVSACLAVVESGILIAMAVFCRNLRGEASVELSEGTSTTNLAFG